MNPKCNIWIVCRCRPSEDLQFVSISEVTLVPLARLEGATLGTRARTHRNTHNNSPVLQMNTTALLRIILQEIAT